MKNDKEVYKAIKQINEISSKYINYVDSANPCALTDRYVEDIIEKAKALTELYEADFIETEMYRMYDGYQIRKRNGEKWLYFAGCYNGKYKWVTDYAYCKPIKTKRTAEEHLKKIRKGCV